MPEDFQDKKFWLMQGDCLERMRGVPDESIDMVLTDPPYGTTACKWDKVIPFDLMWEQLERITKQEGAIIIFGSEPFSSTLRMSNLRLFRYDWIWNKKKVTGFLNSKKRPLVQHEIISVFYRKQPTYNPIIHSNKLRRIFNGPSKDNTTTVYGEQKVYEQNIESDKSFPRSIIEQTAVVGNSSDKINHPSQKPVPLMEYLIKTYTNEKETVLDFTMGGGTTGVACMNIDRKFVGIELDEKYFDIAKNRILDNRPVWY